MASRSFKNGWMYLMGTNDFNCNCGFWLSEDALSNEALMNYAVKEHAEQHMQWRVSYVSAIFER